MKRFLIALFAVALISGAPLLAQYEEDPDMTNELQTEETEVETEVEGTELEIETEVGDEELETETDLTDEDLADDDFSDDELPATGSELPLAGLLGLASLAGAVALRSRS